MGLSTCEAGGLCHSAPCRGVAWCRAFGLMLCGVRTNKANVDHLAETLNCSRCLRADAVSRQLGSILLDLPAFRDLSKP